MAPVLYKPEGKDISKRLWSETLEQLSFAHAAAVLDALNGERVISSLDALFIAGRWEAYQVY